MGVLDWVVVKLGYIGPNPKTIPQQVMASDRFEVGDFVVLTGQNPWKGCIKVGRPYEIQHIIPGSQHFSLLCDNGTKAYFRHEQFIKYTGEIYRNMPRAKEAALEYDEAIRAQELMQGE